ncbi:MAG: DNA polymerase III subunit gamma/tau [Clostridiales bacterium]|nr:DNA polymerase III subunit gamma/tau [Clostridiales bacterium]
MSEYLALYRRFRPTRFSDVVGQEHITRILCNQLTQGLLGHAYLFTGTRGTGKTTCAKLLARAVNCEHPDGADPCGVCLSCQSILDGSSVDVAELDAASNNGVDNIRTILGEAAYPPVSCKKRVYIFDEVHMLSPGAFNALLKTLEEPPAHVLFILATTELHKVPATVLSRCQRFDFRRVEPDVIAGNLTRVCKEAGIDATPEALLLLGRLGDGSVRDAQSLLERCRTAVPEGTLDESAVIDALGLSGAEVSLTLTETLVRGDIAGALRQLDERFREGRDMRAVLEELADVLRDVLLLQTADVPELLRSGGEPSRLKVLAASLSSDRAAFMLTVLRETLIRMQRGSAGRVDTELCLIRMATVPRSAGNAAAPSAVPDTVLQRLAILEETVKHAPPPAPSADAAQASGKPKESEKPKPPKPEQQTPPKTQQKLPPELADKLDAALVRVLGPLKNSFFQMMPKYWDGHTLTAVYDVTGDVLFHDAQAVPQITQEVQKLLGADKKLVFAKEAPLAKAPEEASPDRDALFDAIDQMNGK